MTRIEIATAALAGQLANPTIVENCLDEGVSVEDCIKEIARLSLVAADALLARVEGTA